ncbi:PTS sugar transporter subunit IIC, partial [Enterococcus faecium]|nr:PTS sugar transporter subunit IIC [Enterococcus faecium]
METLSVVQSLLIALWVAAVMSRWLGGGATLTLRFSPLMTGLVVGLIMGEVAQAMIVTAALQMIYMGVFSPGGSMPAEPSIAAAIAVPVALLGDLSPEAAIAVAVPVGLLGSY